MISGMRRPLFVRSLTEDERKKLETGLRSKEAFALRRCQILLASARGEHAPAIAQAVGCDDETVWDVMGIFDKEGLAALQRKSRRPHRIQAAFSPGQAERLRELLHTSPRDFGTPTSVWTLELAAQVSFEQGVTAVWVSDETIRATLVRLGVKWKRAKEWIRSPDPEYVRKKGDVTG
jgi:transposase